MLKFNRKFLPISLSFLLLGGSYNLSCSDLSSNEQNKATDSKTTKELPSILLSKEEANNDNKNKKGDTKAARLYKISVDKWFGTSPKDHGTRTPINQLMKRYNIFSKNLICIGSGYGDIEELWFIKDGQNTVTLFDLDENDQIEERIKSNGALELIPSESSCNFYVGNLSNVVSQNSNQYDVVYMSSFAPHENRRGQIIQAFTQLTPEQLAKTKDLEKSSGASDPAWPSWKAPFEPRTLKESVKLIKNGGLFVYQLYYNGVDVTKNHTYVKNTLSQLKEEGLIPLEIYYLEEAPGILLITAFKGNEKEALTYYKRIQSNPKISTFHGRSDLPKKRSKLLYSLT